MTKPTTAAQLAAKHDDPEIEIVAPPSSRSRTRAEDETRVVRLADLRPLVAMTIPPPGDGARESTWAEYGRAVAAVASGGAA